MVAERSVGPVQSASSSPSISMARGPTSSATRSSTCPTLPLYYANVSIPPNFGRPIDAPEREDQAQPSTPFVPRAWRGSGPPIARPPAHSKDRALSVRISTPSFPLSQSAVQVHEIPGTPGNDQGSEPVTPILATARARVADPDRSIGFRTMIRLPAGRGPD